jgi:hypothetical protein
MPRMLSFCCLAMCNILCLLSFPACCVALQAAPGVRGAPHGPAATTTCATSLWSTRARRQQQQQQQEEAHEAAKLMWWARRQCCHLLWPASTMSTRWVTSDASC